MEQPPSGASLHYQTTTNHARPSSSRPSSSSNPPSNLSSSPRHFRRRWTAERFQDALEDEQGGVEQRERRQSEGDDGSLTELAIPDPISRHSTKRDSLEREESRAERSSHERSSCDRDPDAELTELAVPQPVEEESPSSDQTRAQSLDEKDLEEDEQSQQNKAPPPRQRALLITELYTVSWLIFFSLLGTLARLGIASITKYPNAPISSTVLWSNVGGSLFLGFLAEDRRIFRQEWGKPDSEEYSFHPLEEDQTEKDKDAALARQSANHGKVKKTIPLFIGLATGFCGSFTSFSTFIRDAFLALSNDFPSPNPGYPVAAPASHPIHPRNAGYSFMAVMAILIVHPAVSLAALQFGAHIALLLEPVMPTLPFCFIRQILDPLVVILAFGCWIGAVLLTIFPPETNWRPRATFALIFAPVGVLLRFYASKHLNARVPSFPLGTFFVNVFGTCISGMCFDLQHSSGIGASGGSYTSCGVLEGVMEGFCGCATTVSTWVAELNGLRRSHAYIYGLTSMGVSLGFLVVIMGSVGWTIGFSSPLCLG